MLLRSALRWTRFICSTLPSMQSSVLAQEGAPYNNTDCVTATYSLLLNYFGPPILGIRRPNCFAVFSASTEASHMCALNSNARSITIYFICCFISNVCPSRVILGFTYLYLVSEQHRFRFVHRQRQPKPTNLFRDESQRLVGLHLQFRNGSCRCNDHGVIGKAQKFDVRRELQAQHPVVGYVPQEGDPLLTLEVHRMLRAPLPGHFLPGFLLSFPGSSPGIFAGCMQEHPGRLVPT